VLRRDFRTLVDGLVVGRVGGRVGETLRLHVTKCPSKILVGILLIICVSMRVKAVQSNKQICMHVSKTVQSNKQICMHVSKTVQSNKQICMHASKAVQSNKQICMHVSKAVQSNKQICMHGPPCLRVCEILCDLICVYIDNSPKFQKYEISSYFRFTMDK
jgi:uncharacterized Fe-S cluster protein YjdI